MKKRVVVTGMGVISPIGNTVSSFWDHVKQGTVGIGEITYFDTSEYKVKLAAQVKDFCAADYMDAKAAKRMELFCQYAAAAASQAIKDARLDLLQEDPTRIGVSIGSGIGGLQAIEREHKRLLEKGPKRVNPLLVPLMIPNMAAGNVSILFGLKGKCLNIVTACATGTHSIGEAYRAIQWGEADVMVCGGTEAAITPLSIAGFTALTALSDTTDPKRASIPFDKDRNGFVMGEGAGVVILESYEHAQKRGAKIAAEVVGYGVTEDAYHITAPCEDGEGAARAMKLAMQEANISPSQIDYINAHGTSTPINDRCETLAIKEAFKEAASKVNINSTKSMIGHLLGAAGAVEFITMVKSVQENYIHATVGLLESEPELDLNYTKEPRTDRKVTYAMSNSLGFGGHNASLLVKKYES